MEYPFEYASWVAEYILNIVEAKMLHRILKHDTLGKRSKKGVEFTALSFLLVIIPKYYIKFITLSFFVIICKIPSQIELAKAMNKSTF